VQQVLGQSVREQITELRCWFFNHFFCTILLNNNKTQLKVIDCNHHSLFKTSLIYLLYNIYSKNCILKTHIYLRRDVYAIWAKICAYIIGLWTFKNLSRKSGASYVTGTTDELKFSGTAEELRFEETEQVMITSCCSFAKLFMCVCGVDV